jgi:hypothetical protein
MLTYAASRITASPHRSAHSSICNTASLFLSSKYVICAAALCLACTGLRRYLEAVVALVMANVPAFLLSRASGNDAEAGREAHDSAST